MDVLQEIRKEAGLRKKTIVLPEYYDPRVKEASRIIEQEGIANVLFLTRDKVDDKQKERYVQEFYQLHQVKIPDITDVRKLFEDTLYYAQMLVREGKVDGIVAGASHTTPDMARASIRCLGVDEHFGVVSSCFIMAVPNCSYGERGIFIFADCGIIPDPNPRQLAYLSMAAAELASKVLKITPKVALLSYSTHGSAKAKSIEKVTEALAMLKEISPGLLADGEMQVDAAIIPEVAKIKYPDGSLKGEANVLIFPNLEAGNISYKLVQRLACARAVGPLLLGLNKPASDLSRGCLVEDIVDTVAVTAVRAQ